MKFSQRQLWIIGVIFISVITLLTLLVPPSSNHTTNSGSTYGRAPDGYGAWYAFMTDKGTTIQRLQKPFPDFIKTVENQKGTTLIRVYSRLNPSDVFQEEEDWVKQGNTLVMLGVKQPVTSASFSSLQKSVSGPVKIDTRRRKDKANIVLLGDSFGAVVWQEKLGQGSIIYGTTPHLGANAYQKISGNYEFLSQLVTQTEGKNIPNSIWVDEYLHGYKDAEEIQKEYNDNLITYLSKKPLFAALIQGLVLFLVALFAGLHRFGAAIPLKIPVVNNSKAYIQALAAVLQKANNTDFVVEIVGQEEQLQLQKMLGLGDNNLDTQACLEAWKQQTNSSPRQLQKLLQKSHEKHRLKETDLLTWIEEWQKIRNRE